MESTTDGTSGLAAATPIPARLTVSNNTSPLQTSTIAQSLLLMQQSTGSTLANVFDVRYTGSTATGSSGTQSNYSITVGATPLSSPSTYPLIQLASKTTTLQNTLTVHGKSQFNGDVFITAPVPTPTPSVGLKIGVGSQNSVSLWKNLDVTGPDGSTPLLQATGSTGSQLLTVYGNPTVYIGPSSSSTVSSGATLYVNLQGQSAFFNGPVMLSPRDTLPFTCTANTEGAIALKSDYALCTCFSGSWHKASDPSSTPCWN